MIFLKKIALKFNFSNNKTNSTAQSLPLVCQLKNRSLIILMGSDAQKLLQGIITNDIKQITQKSRPIKVANPKNTLTKEPMIIMNKIAMYTLFLNPKGKIITDAFIFRPKQYQNNKKVLAQNQFWIDVDKSMKDTLLTHLKKYTWKKDVDLIDVDNQESQQNDSGIKPSIFAGFNHQESSCLQQHLGYDLDLKQQYRNEQYSNLTFFDPRGQSFGLRIICTQQSFGITKDFKHSSLSEYEQYQRLLGFTSSNLLTNKLPFQFNFDFLHAISLKKGCYLGQEIVSRSYHTGIVRRRVFPFNIQNQNKKIEISPNTILLDKDKKQIGKVIDYSPQKGGLALVNYLQFFKNQQGVGFQVQIEQPFKGYVFCPFGNKLHQYMNQMNSRQKKLQQLDI